LTRIQFGVRFHPTLQVTNAFSNEPTDGSTRTLALTVKDDDEKIKLPLIC
jgi:hypothetical protein